MIYNCKYCKKKKMYRVYSRQGDDVRFVEYAQDERVASARCWMLNTAERMI